MARLDGKVAIVTGAGRGIGRATALRFAGEGATVVVNDIDPGPAKETVEEIEDRGGTALVSTHDSVDLGNAKDMFAEAAEAFGHIDILINNAGITRDRMFHKLDEDIWDQVLDANLKTTVHCSLAAMPYMREVAKRELEEHGAIAFHRKIVNTSSIVALTGNPGQASYSSAKGAIIAFTKTLARELGPFHINVNAVAPGFIETRLTAPKQPGSSMGIPESARQMLLGEISMGTFGKPEDVANAHLFLASSDADFVSGIVLPITGAEVGG